MLQDKKEKQLKLVTVLSEISFDIIFVLNDIFLKFLNFIWLNCFILEEGLCAFEDDFS